jgi:hypothetical protein
VGGPQSQSGSGGEQNRDRPAHSLVTILTELLRLLTKTRVDKKTSPMQRIPS